jgi:hypothetical protein
MSDEPERIWAWAAGTGMPVVSRIVPTDGFAEYTRADIAEAEAATLRAKLAEARDGWRQDRQELLWAAYYTGHERDGQWSHNFMSDGEWLARECGFDPTEAWYDAAAIKAAIETARIAEDAPTSPTAIVLPPNAEDPTDWRVVLTAPDGKTMTVEVPIDGADGYCLWDGSAYGLNLVTRGHYG